MAEQEEEEFAKAGVTKHTEGGLASTAAVCVLTVLEDKTKHQDEGVGQHCFFQGCSAQLLDGQLLPISSSGPSRHVCVLISSSS